MVKELRRVRRSVGPWRDCDVQIDMLERKARRISNPEERQAWDKVRAFALRKRKRQMDRARRKLAKCTLSTALSAPMPSSSGQSGTSARTSNPAPRFSHP